MNVESFLPWQTMQLLHSGLNLHFKWSVLIHAVHKLIVRKVTCVSNHLEVTPCPHILYMLDMDRRGALSQEGTAAYGKYPPMYSAEGSVPLLLASSVSNGRMHMLLLLNHLF